MSMKRPDHDHNEISHSTLDGSSLQHKQLSKSNDIQLLDLSFQAKQQQLQQEYHSSSCIVAMDTCPPSCTTGTIRGNAISNVLGGDCTNEAEQSVPGGVSSTFKIIISTTAATPTPSTATTTTTAATTTIATTTITATLARNFFTRKRKTADIFGSHNNGFEPFSIDGSQDEREILLKRYKTMQNNNNSLDNSCCSRTLIDQEFCNDDIEVDNNLHRHPISDVLPFHQHHHHHHHHMEKGITSEDKLENGSDRRNFVNGKNTHQVYPHTQQQQRQQKVRRLLQPQPTHCSVDMTGSRRRFLPKQNFSLFESTSSPERQQKPQQRSSSTTFSRKPHEETKTALVKTPNMPSLSNLDPETKGDPAIPNNRLGFRLGKRKILTDRRRFVSNCCLACAMFGIAGMILETEFTMASVYDKSSIYSYMVKTSVTASTVVLLNLILAYYRLQAQLYIVNNSLDDWKVALSWPVVLQATTELVVCSIHPFPGDMRIMWYSVGLLGDDDDDGNDHYDDDDDDDDGGDKLSKIYDFGYGIGVVGDGDGDDDDDVGGARHHHHRHPRYGEDSDGKKRKRRSGGNINNKRAVEVSIDLLFTFPMFLRFYLVGRVMLLQSRILTDASAVSIGALNRISFNVRFVLKALMTICPGTVLVVFMMTVWITTSWTLRVCESYHDGKHKNFLNSLWMIAITFLSVGYGDIVPNTYCGRSVAVFTGIMGSGCTALVVAVFARKMELTRAEKHVHNFMIDNQLSKKLKHAAANVLRETWFIYKCTSLSSKLDPFKIRFHQSKFLQAIHKLRDIRSKLRTLNDNANTMMDVKHLTHSALNTTPTVYSSQPPAIYQQTQLQLSQAITDLYDRQMSAEEKTNSIESTILWMQNRLETLPTLVMEQLSSDQMLESNCDLDWMCQASLEMENVTSNH